MLRGFGVGNIWHLVKKVKGETSACDMEFACTWNFGKVGKVEDGAVLALGGQGT